MNVVRGPLKSCSTRRNQMRIPSCGSNIFHLQLKSHATKVESTPEAPFSVKTFQEIYQRQSFRFKLLFSSGLFIASSAGLVFADWLEKKMPVPPKNTIAEEEEWLNTQSDTKAKLIKELETQ